MVPSRRSLPMYTPPPFWSVHSNPSPSVSRQLAEKFRAGGIKRRRLYLFYMPLPQRSGGFVKRIPLSVRRQGLLDHPRRITDSMPFQDSNLGAPSCSPNRSPEFQPWFRARRPLLFSGSIETTYEFFEKEALTNAPTGD